MNGSRELVRPNSNEKTRALAQAIANLINENGLSYQEAVTAMDEAKSVVRNREARRLHERNY